jgi:hypothetical protein
VARKPKRKPKRKRRKPPDPAALLSSVADALNRCERAGLDVKLRHGIVITEHGYVLPVKDKWAARPLKKRK